MLLKQARERAGLSLEELADKVGMHRQTLYQFESGSRYPTRETVQRIAEVLEYPELEEQFFTREDVRDVRGEPTLVTAVKRLMRKMGIS